MFSSLFGCAFIFVPANLQIVKEVLKLNEDPGVHGLYLHLPPASITSRVLTALKPEKDVEG